VEGVARVGDRGAGRLLDLEDHGEPGRGGVAGPGAAPGHPDRPQLEGPLHRGPAQAERVGHGPVEPPGGALREAHLASRGHAYPKKTEAMS
jgi:hypothetical protein